MIMEIQLPRIFENKLQELTKDLAIELRKLIIKMKELELEDTGYFFFNNGCKVKVTEVELTNEEDEEGLSFCVEEDTVHGTTYTLDSSLLPFRA